MKSIGRIQFLQLHRIQFISQSHLKINSAWINGGREGSYQDPAEKSTVLAHLHGCHFVKKNVSVVKPGLLAIRRRLPPPTAAPWVVNSLTGRLAEGLLILKSFVKTEMP
jgi:hypothetical protein